MDIIRNRIKAALDLLNTLRYSNTRPIDGILFSDGDYQLTETFEKDRFSWSEFQRDETWGGTDRHYWFLAQAKANKELAGSYLRAVLNTGATDIWNTDNPQILVYLNGSLAGTMDMNHQELVLTEKAEEDEEFELAFYAYSNSSWKSNFFHLDISVWHEEVVKLYYDLQVPFEAGDLLPEDDLERINTFKVLNQCIGLLDLRKPGSDEFYQSVREADAFLMEAYYAARTGNPITVHSVGHTHIDVAWKWPVKQTKQKAVRSVQTVLSLMERYPEYKFMLSQPQLYQFVKEEAPAVYEQIKEKVKEGRWEAEGAMWLEPDCNLASGESLIRHILYGRQFFEEELGAEPNEVLWLPDVFGYSASLPQIMKKSGLSYFLTTKLGWNEFNQFPYDTFQWRGIDGSEVLTYLITTRNYEAEGEKKKAAPFATTYNGMQNPTQIMGTWQRYLNKDVSKELLTCYGHGDGGGGPTEEMLEQNRRLEYGVGTCPQTKQSFVKEFFHELEDHMDKSRLPVWSGELYLETHRGTYTSMAENKKYNRQCEFAMGDAEFWSVVAEQFAGNKYPKDELEKDWKLLLLNQFHDILPGSSIKEVYDDSRIQYEEILASTSSIMKNSRKEILESLKAEKAEDANDKIVVWNPLSFARTGVIEIDSDLHLVSDIEPKGFKIIEKSSVLCSVESMEEVIEITSTDKEGRPEKITTPFYQLEFDANGEFTRIYDIQEDRDLLKAGRTGNQLMVFEDRPLEFDAWNIDASYKEKSWRVGRAEEFKVLENSSVRGCLYVKRRFMESVLEQFIYVYRHTGRIDFKTRILWQEHQMLLKTAFPLDILCNEASYEIQFGNVKRPTHTNTTWDKARFEVCAHKWADISEAGYGIALLNDCKYGHEIQDSVMNLTLIKSGIFPNPEADQGLHEFTYALFPHQGDFREGKVVQEAYDLNCPLYGEVISSVKTMSYSFLNIEEENILADTVKKSEEGDGIVIRLYEAYGKRTQVHMTLFDYPEQEIVGCNCMESEEEKIINNQGKIQFEMLPYEIKTIKLK